MRKLKCNICKQNKVLPVESAGTNLINTVDMDVKHKRCEGCSALQDLYTNHALTYFERELIKAICDGDIETAGKDAIYEIQRRKDNKPSLTIYGEELLTKAL